MFMSFPRMLVPNERNSAIRAGTTFYDAAVQHFSHYVAEFHFVSSVNRSFQQKKIKFLVYNNVISIL